MNKKTREKYPSDLTDKEWEEISPLFKGMRNRKWSKRELTDAVLYINKTGCQWRQLPHDFPPYSTVWSFYRRACKSGLWDAILRHLVKITRENAGRASVPTYGIIDSQSVKTIYNSQARGFDGGKKIKGRKRHIIVDIMGNLLAVYVHSANLHDTTMGIIPAILAHSRYPTLLKFCGDQGYRKTFEEDIREFLGLGVDISKKLNSSNFYVLPKRWVVERTFSWMNNSRRLSKDYEISTSSSENMIKVSHSRILLKRLL